MTTALTVGAARGVCPGGLRRVYPSLYEYTPMQVKQAIVGYGKAENRSSRWSGCCCIMEDIAGTDDAADAIAIA